MDELARRRGRRSEPRPRSDPCERTVTARLLGGWWSYEVLGWSGVWAWDPVENASFLPWLTMSAVLHSVMIQEKRGMLRIWNVLLVILAFTLSLDEFVSKR